MAYQISPYGPYWPLGQITVAVPGTPVPLTQNLNAKGQSYTPNGSSEYAASFNQYLLQGGAGNTGLMYLVMPGGSKNDPNSIILTLVPTQFVDLGSSARNGNVFSLTDFMVDADVAGNYVQVTGVVA